MSDYAPRLLNSAFLGMPVVTLKLAPVLPSQMGDGKGKKTVLGRVGVLAPICKVLLLFLLVFTYLFS